jgi:hypothetical protein
MQLSVNPEVVHGFEVSRRKVVESLTNMNFAKIVSIVQLPNKLEPLEPHFQGEVEEVFPSKHTAFPKHAFFSRFSRNTQGVSVMGCFQIVDTAMGTCQASALPQLGDVLVGSFVEAGRKGKIPFEFKGWCNNGKPLLELLRVLQFGTRMSSKELHTLLRQPASVTAAFSLRLNSSTITLSQRRHAQKVSQSADDIWNIARALCFKDLSLDESLKTSVPHWDMMTQLAMNTLDEEFLDELNKIKPPCETQMYSSEPYGNSQHQQLENSYRQGYTLPQGSDFGTFGNKTPEYPSTAADYTGSNTPPYAPSSPYRPTSPAYAPSSPVTTKSPPRLSDKFSVCSEESGEIASQPLPIISSATILDVIPSPSPKGKKRAIKKDEKSKEEEEPKKKQTKRKKIAETNPVLYSPTTDHTHSLKSASGTEPEPEPEPILYSPRTVPMSNPLISLPAQSESKGKSILGSLLAKINSPSKLQVVSYEDI